jgi:hypothetical protein
MNTILLTAGVVALMAAVIGGGLKAFQIDMPVLPTLRVRAALGALGIAFLIAAVLLAGDPTPPGTSACSDGRDNDSDGKIDYPDDSGCSSAQDRAEKNAEPATGKAPCSDGADNDRDGKIDYPSDRGCSSPDDLTEKEAPCSDGADNDRDGKIDYPNDPGCSSPDDLTESQ